MDSCFRRNDIFRGSLNFFLWQTFKIFKSERRVDNADVTDFQEENSKLYSGTFKGLAPSTTPFRKEKVY